MITMEWKSTWAVRTVFALVAVALMCLVPAFGQDSVLSVQGSGSYDIGYYVNANVSGVPHAQLHVTNPGSTGGFGAGETSSSVAGGDLCANVYVFTPDQQLAECCSCKISPNGMQAFDVTTDLTANPFTPATPQLGAIKIVASFGGSQRGAGLPPTPLSSSNKPQPCDAGSAYWPQGRLESWVTHVRPLGTSLGAAYTVTEINFLDAQLSWSELKKLEQECFAIEADASFGGEGSGAGVCNCDANKQF